jgi:exopolyphosphatase / guanosine-5'-triphosphate,3'-diphosphate pyrophosphatase
LFRSLSPEHRRIVQTMTPVLRLALALDTGRQNRVKEVSCQITDAGATVRIRGNGELDLEIWAAERAAEAFRHVYEVPMSIVRAA